MTMSIMSVANKIKKEGMETLPETGHYLIEEGFDIVTQDTEKASQTFNQVNSDPRLINTFHLAC